MDWDENSVKVLILEILEPRLRKAQVSAEQAGMGLDLYHSGIVDSYDVIELLIEVQEKTGLETNLASESAEDFVLTVDGLSQSFFGPTADNVGA